MVLFIVEDWHNFGAHYDKKLMEWRTAWFDNFDRNWEELKSKYDDRFLQNVEVLFA